MMLKAWESPEIRATKDIDILAVTINDENNIVDIIKDILNVEVEPDGLYFDTESIRSENITEKADYQGIRVLFNADLDSAKIKMQIDIGFGDIVHPKPEKIKLPTMLDHPPPILFGYTKESVIAEKLEAIVKLGLLNSRMKDFFDILLLSRQFDFNATVLKEAIKRTFDNRNTVLIPASEIFTPSFIEDKHVQWAAFHKRLDQDFVSATFSEVTDSLDIFLTPIIDSILNNNESISKWIAPGPWT